MTNSQGNLGGEGPTRQPQSPWSPSLTAPQSLSLSAVQADGQQPSPSWQTTIGSEPQLASQVSGLPLSVSVVQLSPSSHSVGSPRISWQRWWQAERGVWRS